MLRFMGGLAVIVSLGLVVGIAVIIGLRLSDGSIGMIAGIVIGALVWTPCGYAIAGFMNYRDPPAVRGYRVTRAQPDPEPEYQPVSAYDDSPRPAIRKPQRSYMLIGATGDVRQSDGDVEVELR